MGRAKTLVVQQVKRGFDGFFKVDQLYFSHSLYQGGVTPVIEREVFGRGQAAVVLLYNQAQQQIALVEQCRAGALYSALGGQVSAGSKIGEMTQAERAWLIEPVAGMIEQGEDPRQACQRETQEEAGAWIELEAFERIAQFFPSPGGCSEQLHLYAAEVDILALPEFSGLAEEQEDIRLVKWSFSEAKQALFAGDIQVASTLIALQWLFFQKQVKMD